MKNSISTFYVLDTQEALDASSHVFKIQLEYIIDTLKENEPGHIISSYELFGPIYSYVVNNLPQNPERLKIVDTGHDGGDFLFYAKLE